MSAERAAAVGSEGRGTEPGGGAAVGRDPEVSASGQANAVAIASEGDIEALRQRFGDEVIGSGAPLGEAAALVDRSALLDAARYLRDELGYQLLLSVTAVDLLPHEPRFHVVYHLTAMPASALAGDAEARGDSPARLLRLKVPLSADDAVVDSLTELYPTAGYHEREAFDMFGIEFAGHPDLRRILMPEDHDGHPLRKDHPLGYEPVAFTHNEAEIHDRKPLATE